MLGLLLKDFWSLQFAEGLTDGKTCITSERLCLWSSSSVARKMLVSVPRRHCRAGEGMGPQSRAAGRERLVVPKTQRCRDGDSFQMSHCLSLLFLWSGGLEGTGWCSGRVCAFKFFFLMGFWQEGVRCLQTQIAFWQ